MADQMRSDYRSVPREKIQNARRDSRFLKHLHEHCAADDRLLGWFHDNRVTRYHPGRCHSAQDCDRKIPRGNDEGDAARPVVMVTFFAGHLLCKLWAPEAAHLVSVKATKINRLADIGISFLPRLACFENFNCGELISSTLQDVGGALQ